MVLSMIINEGMKMRSSRPRCKGRKKGISRLAWPGDLLYWGARGFQRDHVRARRFFKVAADADHAHARCLYASMLLRGEGVTRTTPSGRQYGARRSGSGRR